MLSHKKTMRTMEWINDNRPEVIGKPIDPPMVAVLNGEIERFFHEAWSTQHVAKALKYLAKAKRNESDPPFKLDLMTSAELMAMPPESMESQMFRYTMSGEIPDGACMVRGRAGHHLVFCSCGRWHRIEGKKPSGWRMP